MTASTLAVVPARSGSKGLPDKNVRTLHDKPLIAWSILQARASDRIDEVVLSTDSEEYAEIGESYGASVPFIRPDEYSTDDAPTSDVVLHALDFYRERGESFDRVATLEPTSPLRKPGDVDSAISRFEAEEEATALVSVGSVHLENPYWMKQLNDGWVEPLFEVDDDLYQRQKLPTAYFPYGVLYLSETESYREFESMYQDQVMPYDIERWQNYEIDDIYDFICVERVIEHVGSDVAGYDA